MKNKLNLEHELALKLISVDSVSQQKDEKTDKKIPRAVDAIVDLAKTWLVELGYKPELIREDRKKDGRLDAIVAAGTDTDILFQGHLDTMPKGDKWGKEKGKEHNYKWDGEITNIDGEDILFGRGTVDMKAQIGSLFAALHETKKRPHIIFTTDEEIFQMRDFKGIRQAMKYFSGKELTAKYAVNMEATDFKIVYARKGAIYGKLYINGITTHGSAPDKGINAIYRAATIINAIQNHAEDLKQKVDSVLGYRTINVGTISGGDAPNNVPASCVIELESRLLPGETAEESANLLVSSIVKQTGLKYGQDDDFYFDLLMSKPAYRTNRVTASDLQKCLTEQVGAGGEAGLAENPIIEAAGIPTVSFGQTEGDLSHTSNEHVALKDLTRLKTCYLELIEANCR